MWLLVYHEFLLLPLTPTQDFSCIYSSFRRLTWSLGVTPGLDHVGEMQGDQVRVSWDCIAQGVLAWHGWIPNSVKRRPSIREGRMVSATQVDTHRGPHGRERNERHLRPEHQDSGNSHSQGFILSWSKCLRKEQKCFLQASGSLSLRMLPCFDRPRDPGLFCKWVCCRWPRALWLSWFHQQSRRSSHTMQ